MQGNETSTLLHDALLQAWECVFADSPVTYLSGPITTGLAHVSRLKGLGGPTRELSIQENCSQLRNTAVRLRKERNEIIIEPATLNIAHWSQREYLRLWASVIERHVNLILFMPGWEYSYGCSSEFFRAQLHGLRTETITGSPITIDDALGLYRSARNNILKDGDAENEGLHTLANKLEEVFTLIEGLKKSPDVSSTEPLRKDKSLDLLAEKMNVAQFVSFSPRDGTAFQEYARIAGESPLFKFSDLRSAIEKLLNTSSDGSINVRSYEPFNPQSREFIYGITKLDDAVDAVNRLSREGLYTIVNETIDIHDGGVSGVLMGDILEFAPDDTPRCVEKPGTASLPRSWGRELLSSVYGFPVTLDVPRASRLEFSIHPKPRGWRQSRVLGWEYSSQALLMLAPELRWPNLFSRLVGDKTFGLLVAHHAGLPVPFTTVVNRRIAPFSFGRPTKSGEGWIRTAPLEQVPGKYTTYHGWLDPFLLVKNEDPDDESIMSVLSQQGVVQKFSGALIVGIQGQLIIEGKKGEGETFMLGESSPEQLPDKVRLDVISLYERAKTLLGTVRFEWVHDGDLAWVVQLHAGSTESDEKNITSLKASQWQAFDIRAGLSELRKVLQSLPNDVGIELVGRVGLTSHFADVLRRAKVPARMR